MDAYNHGMLIGANNWSRVWNGKHARHQDAKDIYWISNLVKKNVFLFAKLGMQWSTPSVPNLRWSNKTKFEIYGNRLGMVSSIILLLIPVLVEQFRDIWKIWRLFVVWNFWKETRVIESQLQYDKLYWSKHSKRTNTFQLSKINEKVTSGGSGEKLKAYHWFQSPQFSLQFFPQSSLESSPPLSLQCPPQHTRWSPLQLSLRPFLRFWRRSMLNAVLCSMG